VDLGLTGKVALVTAASGGLGFAIAKELAAEGATAVIAARNPERLEAARTAIAGATGADVTAIRADCTRSADIDALIGEIERRFGRLDVLINNSGGPPTAPFTELSDADWHAAFDAKFLPQVRCARAAFPGMARRKWGRIITIIGSHGRTPHAYAIPAGVVNAALLNLTKALAELGALDNVLVTAINPGPIETDRVRYLVKVQMEKLGINEVDAKRRIAADILLGRFGEPDDVAAAAVFLASERARFVTGAFFDIDGGFTRSL
jgi:NAD(P)-dependent dehydrogenase (short-subunit alcohol dehydrogenase family)